jgi:hypothetical protein
MVSQNQQLAAHPLTNLIDTTGKRLIVQGFVGRKLVGRGLRNRTHPMSLRKDADRVNIQLWAVATGATPFESVPLAERDLTQE